MSRNSLFRLFSVIFIFLAGNCAHGQSPSVTSNGSDASTQGELKLSVVIVDELTPKPVPFTTFNIVNNVDSAKSEIVKTDANGLIDVMLAPGSYTIENVKPVEFKQHSYSWKSTITVNAGKTLTVNLSDSDAVADTIKPERQISDEAKIYEICKSGVVTVEGDRGQGSGFIVDPSGLIVTNQHVVAGGVWTAVRFDRGIRVPAEIVAQDRDADVAVIRVNPAAYKDFTVLPLADTSQPLAVVGEKVLAIGSPLHQEKVLTIGIVSKVEEDYLVSDININHGNSGGPLINMAGNVIGITTFLDSTTNGPGISGIISITKALPVIAKAKTLINSLRLPVAERLPDISPVPIPGEALDAYKSKDCQPWSTGHPKNFETILVTPFYSAALQREYDEDTNSDRERRINKRDGSGVHDEQSQTTFWERYGLHVADPVVYIIVRPTLQTTSGSKWRSVFGAMVGAHVQLKKEFRDDFWDMALYRGNTLVHPVRRSRDNVEALYADYDSYAKDSALGGIYFYDPSVFAPGAELKLYVRRESDLNRWDVVNIDRKEQERIYKMFEPYRNALAEAGGDTSIQGLSSSIHTPPGAGADWTEESQEERNLLSNAVTPAATPVTSAPTSLSSGSGTVAPAQNPQAAGSVHSELNAGVPQSAPAASPPNNGTPATGTGTATPSPAAVPTSVSPQISASAAAAPPTPKHVSIDHMPCKVKIVTVDGYEYTGTATDFDGSDYKIQTDSGDLEIFASKIASVQYL